MSRLFTIKLISNTKDSLVYDIWDEDRNEYVNQIEVSKKDFSYHLKSNQKLSNSYESSAFRAIKRAISMNVAPKEYSDGWG
ncbi:hypothetical protein LZE20_08410 [Lactobacillus jensenii]|uniref:hypothetical protein n=1 Tax=Lactobacillus jensenii TaxID=109790 RepID=UPI001F1BF921|nr:hypothetical protein [Lactobacillus jensenii]MCF1843912.1 hypothetical protein [Lactobacillus jensenii]